MRYSTLWSMPATLDERLRELYFGDHEGEHFDTNPEIGEAINTMKYHAPNGESWEMVKRRFISFFKEKFREKGVYLCYTHGGAICSLTYDLGI